MSRAYLDDSEENAYKLLTNVSEMVKKGYDNGVSRQLMERRVRKFNELYSSLVSPTNIIDPNSEEGRQATSMKRDVNRYANDYQERPVEIARALKDMPKDVQNLISSNVVGRGKKKPRKQSAWISRLKDYQAKHGCSYKEAMVACSGKTKTKTKSKKAKKGQKGGFLPLAVMGAVALKGAITGAATAGASYGVNKAINGKYSGEERKRLEAGWQKRMDNMPAEIERLKANKAKKDARDKAAMERLASQIVKK